MKSATAAALVAIVLSLSAPAQAQTLKYAFCYGLAGNPRVENFTPVFEIEPGARQDSMTEAFRSYLYRKYVRFTTQENACPQFATAAEASAERQKIMGMSAPYKVVELDWTAPSDVATSAAAAAAPSAPAPAPAAAAAPAPKPAPHPAPPATNKPGVFVTCRSEFNTEARRFYQPPVEGRDGDYPKWQESWRAYLVSHLAFKGSNISCGKYPTKEAAQADYDSWVAAARATPTVNGVDSPIVITDWVY